MKKYITEYLQEIDNILEGNIKEVDKLIEKHLIKISFFSHERIVHLLVTLAYGITVVLGFILSIGAENIIAMIIPLLLMFFLVPYIYHYFLLENSVHKLYVQYDKMLEKKK